MFINVSTLSYLNIIIIFNSIAAQTKPSGITEESESSEWESSDESEAKPAAGARLIGAG